MPNVKLYVEEAILAAHKPALVAALRPLRDLLCAELSVPPAACQVVIVPVAGLADQPPINVELALLPRPERTRDKLMALAATIRADLAAPSGGAAVAVRISALDPQTYIALK